MNPATLSLEFLTGSGDATYLRVSRQDPPWRAIRAFANESGESLVHLHNVSGGVLGGDDLALKISLKACARAQVTSVSATRIYKRKADNLAASQASCFHLAEGAFLEYLPDVVIPYSGARFHQSSEFNLAQGSGLIAWEMLAAGRTGKGESFSFEELTSMTSINGLGHPLAMERYSLRPSRHILRSAARFGNFEHSASMWICLIDNDTARWTMLESELNEAAEQLSGAEVQWGASTLIQHGLVIRGLACEAYLITRGLETFWRMAKQNVWKRPAVMPRKVR